MKNMTVKRAAELCGGTLRGDIPEDIPIREIVIDTRALAPGDLFAAFRGEHVDGADFIGAAFEKGAACCLAERVPEGETRPVILVENVLKALEKLSAAYRAQFDLPVVGITGSVGKTTAKEMISAVMEQRYHTLKTEGNLNNQIGIPMMLSRLSDSHEAAVIEMGISDFGEMYSLARMVQPTMAVYTVIGHAHLEFLHDLDGVLQAKTELLEMLPKTAPVIVNGDDEKLRSFSCRQRKITFGFDQHCDVRAENITTEEELRCDIVCGLRRIPVEIPAFGQHHIYAALAAATVGMLLGLSDQEIKDGIASFHNVGRRGELFHGNGFTMIDDSYNANPDSVDCGIDTLMRVPGKRHLCILGDMLELGENAMNMHYGVGCYAVENGVDLILTSGRCAAEMSRAAGARGMHFASREELIKALPRIVKKEDCILVKASKGSHFETVAAALRKLIPENVETGTTDAETESAESETAPCVMLDLDDTILDFRKAEHRALSRSLTELGVPHDEQVLSRYSEINKKYWEQLEDGAITREQVLVGRFQELLSELGVEADAARLRDLYEKNLSEGHFFIEGAEDLLKSLQGKYRMFLISNGTATVQEGRLSSAGISHFFERIFISEKLGANKPDKAFFERCFAQIPEFDREHCLVVGDSLTSDIRGGINAGVKTCWFNLRQNPYRKDIVPDYQIKQLSDLPVLLEKVF